jgi:hypothetical protein
MQNNLLFLNSIVNTSFISTAFFIYLFIYLFIGKNRVSPYIHTYVIIYVTSLEPECSDETKRFQYNFDEPVYVADLFFLTLLCSSTSVSRLY